MMQQLYAQIQALQQQLRHVQHQQAQQQQAPAAPPADPSTRVRPRMPETFNGEVSQLLRTQQFLTEVERYLTLAGLLNHPHVIEHAAQFLTGNAGVWFNSVQSSVVPITTFAQFKHRLQEHFTPYGTARLARTQLYALAMNKNGEYNRVHKYNAEFHRLIAYIHDMNEADQLEIYIRGLLPHLRNEVHRKEGLDTLQKAMNHAAFVEALFSHNNQRQSFIPYQGRSGFNNDQRYGHYSSSATASSGSSGAAPMDLNLTEATPVFHDDPIDTSSAVNAIHAKPKSSGGPTRFPPKLTHEEKMKCLRENLCLRCRKPGHMARECPTFSSFPKNVRAQ